MDNSNISYTKYKVLYKMCIFMCKHPWCIELGSLKTMEIINNISDFDLTNEELQLINDYEYYCKFN